MKSIVQKLVLVSFILAIGAGAAVFVFLQSLQGSTEVNADSITVLVASETIPPRTLIERKMVKEVQVPPSSLYAQYLTESGEIVGKYTKETILKNEGFHSAKMLTNGSGELPMNIPTNYRAVSIYVSGDEGVSHLIKPGDSVDIVKFTPDKNGGQSTGSETARIILQNIKLLAIDKQLDRDNKMNLSTEVPSTFLVTLSVPVNQVEGLILADNTGTLKLVLRPLSEP